MKILIMGPHGSGKTTLGKMLSQHYNIPFISSGEILREYSKFDENIKRFLESKTYVTDDIVNEIILKYLLSENCKNGFILEGYPRTITQLYFLEKHFDIDFVLNLIVREDVLMDRLLYRLVCPSCKANYNTKLKPPKNDELCDVCNVKLEKRIEDTEEGIKKRYEEYLSKTTPVLEIYKRKGKVIDVDVSENDLNKNFEKCIKIIDEFRRNRGKNKE
ncbi:MAG: nucleoside monophosphate kinase [Candidatus Aenigmatarchaeota archaeon]